MQRLKHLATFMSSKGESRHKKARNNNPSVVLQDEGSNVDFCEIGEIYAFNGIDNKGDDSALALRNSFEDCNIEDVASPQLLLHTDAEEEAAIYGKINGILAAMPYSDHLHNAAITNQLGDYVVPIYREKSALQKRIDQWVCAASELHDIVKDQQEELIAYQEEQSMLDGVPEAEVPSELEDRFEEAFVQQQEELTELLDLVPSLQSGGTHRDAVQHSAFEAVVDKLRSARQQLFTLQNAHKLAIRYQASLLYKEAQELQAENMQLRASKTEQKSIIQDTCEERERLWNLQVESEAQLDDYFRSAELLRQEVESQERELQELRAALASGFAVPTHKQKNGLHAGHSHKEHDFEEQLSVLSAERQQLAEKLMEASAENDDLEEQVRELKARLSSNAEEQSERVPEDFEPESCQWSETGVDYEDGLSPGPLRKGIQFQSSFLAGHSEPIMENDAPKAGGQTIKIQVLADPGACIQSLHSDVEDSDQSTPVSVNKESRPAEAETQNHSLEDDRLVALANSGCSNVHLLPVNPGADDSAQEQWEDHPEGTENDFARLDSDAMAGESAGSTREKLQHTENALADCQEMLEELQAYSLKQSDEINFLGGQLNDAKSMNIDVRGRLEMAQLELSVNSDEIVALKVEVKALETERKRLQHDLEIAVELTMKRLKAGAAELANSPQHEKEGLQKQMNALTEALQKSKADSGAHLESLTQQLAENSENRAEAEARAVASHQAMAVAYTASQEQIQVLQHKTQEQENVIRQLSQAQSNTPRSKENLNSNLMNLSPSPGSAATPKSRRLHSVKQSTGKHRRGSPSLAPASARSSQALSSPREAVRHLHFNPVYGEAGLMIKKQLSSRFAKPPASEAWLSDQPAA